MSDVLKECSDKMKSLHNNMNKCMGILDFYNRLDNEDRTLNNAIDAYTDNLNKQLKENIGQETKDIISKAISMTDDNQIESLEPIISLIDEEFMKWYLIEWDNIYDIMRLYKLLRDYDRTGQKFRSMVFLLNSDIYITPPNSLSSLTNALYSEVLEIVNLLGLNYTKYILPKRYNTFSIYTEILLQLHIKSEDIESGKDIHIDICNDINVEVKCSSTDNIKKDGIPPAPEQISRLSKLIRLRNKKG